MAGAVQLPMFGTTPMQLVDGGEEYFLDGQWVFVPSDPEFDPITDSVVGVMIEGVMVR